MKNLKFKILSLVGGLLFLPIIAMAYTVEKGSAVFVGENKVIEGNYLTAGTSITIDGHITGDLFCVGQSLVINGSVDGDVICAGQSVSVNGMVGGSVRVAASDINIRGSIDRSLSAAAANINIEKTAEIGWDVMLAAANAQIRGELGRSLLGAGANFVLGGSINDDVNLYLDDNNKNNKNSLLSVGDEAVIGGRLTYTSASKANISDQAQIGGEVTQKTPSLTSADRPTASPYISFMIFAILSALLIGLVLVKIWPNQMQKITDGMTDNVWSAIGWGLVVAIVTPFVVLLMAVTLIGLRLAFLVFAVWLILMMVSKVVAGIAIGRLLTGKYWQSQKNSLTISMSVGILIVWLIFYIPIIGWLVSLFAMWWGAGGIIAYFNKNVIKEPRR